MKLKIESRKVIGVLDDRDDQRFPKVNVLLDDGTSGNGRQNVIAVEINGKSLETLRELPEPGDSFEAPECYLSSRESNGRVFTTLRAWKFRVIPGGRQPNQNDEAPPPDDSDIPF